MAKELTQVPDDLFRTIRFVYNLMSWSIAQELKDIYKIFISISALFNYFSSLFLYLIWIIEVVKNLSIPSDLFNLSSRSIEYLIELYNLKKHQVTCLKSQCKRLVEPACGWRYPCWLDDRNLWFLQRVSQHYYSLKNSWEAGYWWSVAKA